MPRIDPTRLLLCLRPLLNFESGGIKSDKEVDKVFGLMSKFSKKLVSKCTYINILHATSPDILNLFMERGGWGMMYDWTVDAKQSKNNSLLNEILQLLLITPATINRLKENSLPKEIKQISSRWECEESKTLAERIVAKWISIAKNENQPEQTTSTVTSTTTTVGQIPANNTMSTSNQPTYTLACDREGTPNMDIDVNYDDTLTDADLNDFNMNMVDFNPEFFSTSIDQHLSELNNSTESDNSFQLTNVSGEQIQFVPSNSNHAHLIQNSSSEPGVQSTSPNVPSIVIKTSGGQHSVVKPVTAVQVIQQSQEATAEGGQGQEKICLVTHNGQRVILRVHVPNTETGNQNSKASVVIPAQQQDQPVTSSGEGVTDTKKRRPRKDPTITNTNSGTKKKQVPDKSDQNKQVLKTYSKKSSADVETTSKAGGGTASSKGKEKTKTKSSSNSNKSSSSASSSSKRSSKSSIAAAAAAEAEKAEKLRQQSKEAKKKMKERMELEKKKLEQDRQQQKDSKTLKEIYGSSTPQTSVPKIPKKKPSFDEMIGVPGAKEELKKEKITKDKQSESLVDKSSKNKEKVSNNSQSEKDTSLSNEKDGDNPSGENVDAGFGAHSRPESTERGPVKERRHQVKVYVSSKSKNMDLLETMTKGSKNKPTTTNDVSSTKNSSISFEDALNSSNSSSASVKPGKRPSLDSTGKSGETKKLKLDDSFDKKDKSDNAKDKKGPKDDKKDKDGAKGSSSSSAAAAAAKKLQGIQESSLFMDALTATRDTSKLAKRKRRTSSSTDPKDVSSPSNGSKENKSQQKEDISPAAQITKPPFNFYRETLNNDEDNEEIRIEDGQPLPLDIPIMDPNTDSARVSDAISIVTNSVQVDDFAPVEGEGKLKSCLCIHRPKGRPKKGVKWREDDELKEYHYFEMDETERVNVSRPNKNFSEMKILERSEEKLVLRRKMVSDSMEEATPWRLPRKLFLDPSTPSPKVESNEKMVQEERERSILQVFYFPGTQLPDHPSEVDVLDIDFDKTTPYTLIPGDDIPTQTKVYDCRKDPWPKPNNSGGPQLSLNTMSMPNAVPPTGFPNAFSAPPPTDAFDSFNPWSQSFAAATGSASAPVGNDPWKMPPDMSSSFSPFPPPAVNLIPPPFGFSPVGFSQPPPVVGQPPCFPPPFSTPPFDLPNVPMSRDDGRQSSRGRDMDYRSDDRIRRNDNRSERRPTDRSDRRDRDRDRGRDRERSFDSRGGDRGSRDRDRHFDNKDRDYRHSDRGSFRRQQNGRRSTLCNYFAKGYCREGHKCSFLHPGVNGAHGSSNENSASNSSSSRNNKSSPPQSPPLEGSVGDNDTSGRTTPPRTNNPEPSSNHDSPTSTITICSSGSSRNSDSSSEIPPIASPTQEPDSFDLPPSSPNDSLYPPGTEPKVIPTFTDEDWG